MAIVFRGYREGDSRGIVELLRKCFTAYSTWGLTEEDWLLFEATDYGFRRENAVVAEENGGIVGIVQTVYRKLGIGSSYVDTGGVSNVCVDPVKRGGGIARSLMKLALELIRMYRWPLSSLVTGYGSAGYRVYRALGYSDTFFFYEYVGYMDRAEKALKRLRAAADVDIGELGDSHLNEVVHIYEVYASSLSGAVWRPFVYWRDRVFQRMFCHSFAYDEAGAGIRLIAKKHGRVMGYAIGLLQDRARRRLSDPGTGAVLELAALDGDAARALLREMLQRLLNEGVKVFRLFLPEDPALMDALAVFEKFKDSIYMDYIIDQNKLFEQLSPELRRRLEVEGVLIRLGWTSQHPMDVQNWWLRDTISI